MAQSAAIQDASYTRHLYRYGGLFNNLLELLLETVSGVSERAGKRMPDNGPYPGDSLLRLQRVETDILKAVDAVCRENGLVYFLDGGTCLGAVRHGGFIPWDDDADIGMPYDDYQKFLEIAPTALPEGYSLHTCTNSEGFSALWSKVYKDGTRFIDANSKEASSNQGIFVDIFPFFPMESDERARSKQVRSCANWQCMSYLHAFSNPKNTGRHPFEDSCRAWLQDHALYGRQGVRSGKMPAPPVPESPCGKAWYAVVRPLLCHLGPLRKGLDLSYADHRLRRSGAAGAARYRQIPDCTVWVIHGAAARKRALYALAGGS